MIGRLVSKARLSDVATERVQAALATLRDSGRSAQTCNHYRAGIRAFARWTRRTGRLREYPLEGLTGFNVKEDRRHDRRTLSLADLTRLIAVAERGPGFQAMTGPARALCYRLAASTGLRYSEIGSIKPASFDWKAPSVTIQAAYTKNGDPATLPIPTDLAADLRSYVATLAADSPVFPLPEKGAAMLRADLEAAGNPLRGCIRSILRLPCPAMPDRHVGRCRWRVAPRRATADAAFEPGTDRPLHQAPGRGHRGRRRDAAEPEAGRGPARKSDRNRNRRAGWPPTTVRSDRPGPAGPRGFRSARPTHKQTLWPPFGHRTGRFRAGCVAF